MIAGNNNVVKAIIDGAFTENCIIDTGTCLSFLDSVFVRTHGLQLVTLKPGTTCVYMTAEKTKIRDIGATSITLSFGDENFVFKFQVVNKLSIYILLGMDFILHNNCVPFENKQLFFSEWSGLGANGCRSLRFGKFGKSPVGGLHQELKDNSVFLKKPLQNTKFTSPILQGNNHALTHVSPQTSASNYIDMVKETRSNQSSSTCTTLDPKSRTFFPQNNTYVGKSIHSNTPSADLLTLGSEPVIGKYRESKTTLTNQASAPAQMNRFSGVIKGADIIWASELLKKDRLNSVPKLVSMQHVPVRQKLHSGNQKDTELDGEHATGKKNGKIPIRSARRLILPHQHPHYFETGKSVFKGAGLPYRRPVFIKLSTGKHAVT